MNLRLLVLVVLLDWCRPSSSTRSTTSTSTTTSPITNAIPSTAVVLVLLLPGAATRTATVLD